MKNFAKVAALVLAAGMSATIAGCAGCASCMGCNSNAKTNTLTNSNWFTGTSYKGVQPSFIYDENKNYTKEIISYDVTYNNTNAINASYTLEYDKGAFSTEFYAFEYDWNTNKIENYKTDEKEILYAYKTRLAIKVRYALKGGDKAQSQWFDDSVTTECYFRPAGKSLQPVYSKQEIASTSPANFQTNVLENAYSRVEENYENFYDFNCTEVTSVKNGNFTEPQIYKNLNKLKSTLFDNSSLYIALRSMRLSANFSQPISLFSAAAGGVSSYTVTGTDRALSDEERASFTAILKGKGLYVPAAEDDKGVNAAAANVNFAGGDLAGTTQTIWYASVDDPDYNVPRATMLKISIPLSFSLGTLNITLKEITSTIWNG